MGNRFLILTVESCLILRESSKQNQESAGASTVVFQAGYYNSSQANDGCCPPTLSYLKLSSEYISEEKRMPKAQAYKLIKDMQHPQITSMPQI